MTKPVAWIIGASSGLGAALAQRLAATGYIVCASARRTDRLKELNQQNSAIAPYPLDCADHRAIKEVADTIILAHGRLDLVVFAAVLTDQTYKKASDIEQGMRVGTLACVQVVEAVLPHMRERSSGQIAIIGSPVGFRALPGARRYGMDKASLHYFAESLRIDLIDSGIDVQLILPGFVKTPLTAKNSFPMPFLMDLDEAMDRIVRGLQKPQKFEIAFPRRLIWTMRVLQWLPYPAYFFLMRRIAKSMRK